MKRDDFINSKLRVLKEMPRRRSLAGRDEKEAALTDDIICDLDPHCLLMSDYPEIEKYRIRFRGNDYYFKIFDEHPGSLRIIAESKVWHKPIIHSQKPDETK